MCRTSTTCYRCRMSTTLPAYSATTRRFRRDVFAQQARALGYATVDEQAKAVGLCRQQLSAILNGRWRPNIDTLDRMVDVLGIPADDFYPRVAVETQAAA